MERNNELIGLDEALRIVGSVPVSPRVEMIRLENALGRVLAREVKSPIDSPPFDKSAMDGFALRAGEKASELHVVDTVAAGGVPAREVRAGEAARIMTGAMLPPGTSQVIRKEYVKELHRDGGTLIQVVTPESGDNVIRRGGSLAAGSVLLEPRLIGAADVGILAASGIDQVPAGVPPRTAVVCTGPEIRPPGQALGPGEIYNSNGPQLRAQLALVGCAARVTSGIEDQPGPLAAVIAREMESSDVLLLTGGVSAGDFDYVPACLRDAGAEILFHRVSVKPGKPTLFARRGPKFVFGLPGNPVSTFVIFELFVKPFLFRMMGLDWKPRLMRGTLSRNVRRAAADRTELIPVRRRGGLVEPVAYRGSAHLNALADADGLIRVEIGVSEIPQGTEVDVRPI